jgi:hypothetical protein
MNSVARASVGAAVWMGFVFARVPDLRDAAWAHALLLFAALVLVPLALDLFADKSETGQRRPRDYSRRRASRNCRLRCCWRSRAASRPARARPWRPPRGWR